MTNEKKGATESELSAWKKVREKRKRDRQKQRQEDEAGDQDNFAALPRTLDGDNIHDGYVNGVGEPSNKAIDDDVPFVPLVKRKRLEKEALIGGMAHRRRHIGMANVEGVDQVTTDLEGEVEGVVKTYIDNDDKGQENDDNNQDEIADPRKVESLLDSATALQESLTEEERAEKQRKEEEARIMKEASKVQTNALQAASELAKGIQYVDSMPATWTCPRYILGQGEDAWEKVRKEWHMEVEGVDVPPPCKRFVDMKLAPPILEVLKRKGKWTRNDSESYWCLIYKCYCVVFEFQDLIFAFFS
jgi:hypothetical protein